MTTSLCLHLVTLDATYKVQGNLDSVYNHKESLVSETES